MGSTAASNPRTQEKFLQIMGIVEESTSTEVEVDCPLTQEAMNIIAAANSHQYSSSLESVPNTDGLYLQKHHNKMMRMRDEGVYQQCRCVALRELLHEEKPDNKCWLPQLLRTPALQQNDMGILFVVSSLRALVKSARQIQLNKSLDRTSIQSL